MSNLFMPIYKNLEKETLKLSEDIFFNDEQLTVYSIKIAELLVRTVVEIESLSKELYFNNGGPHKYTADGKEDFIFFDTDCIAFLEQKWKLSKKEVLVTASNFYFQDPANKILTPLYKANKRGTSASDWARAYQAVKHDRSKNFKRASVKHLIRALAALYILNIYNKTDEEILDETTLQDISFGSLIFTPQLQQNVPFKLNGDNKQKGNENCICIIKYPDDIYKRIISAEKDDCQIRLTSLLNSSEFKEFIKRHPSYELNGKNIFQICHDIENNIGQENYCTKILSSSCKSSLLLINSKKQIVLNKNQQIYPDLSID